MTWAIENHPAGGLQITHLAPPRFTARWTTGAFPIDQVQDGAFFWTDEGGGVEDAIHLYGFAWCERMSKPRVVCRMMKEAVRHIEGHIEGQV